MLAFIDAGSALLLTVFLGMLVWCVWGGWFEE